MRINNPGRHYDIAIVGGGMVGASFALALAASPKAQALRILVIEAAEPPQHDGTVFDARTTALSYGSRRIYDMLGLWPQLSEHAEPIRQIHVSDRGRFGATRIDADFLEVEALGYVVENRHLNIVLHQALNAAPGIDLLCPATILQLRPLPDGMQIELRADDEQHRISADLVVLADGGKSDLSQLLGIDSTVTTYQQSAIISNVAFSRPHDNIAYERFTDAGPIAVLPLSPLHGENRGALIWTLPEEKAAQVLALPDEEFLAQLQARFGRRLGRLTRAGMRAAYPLSLRVAREQVRPGLVLLGNVAHTLHPVAGQGLNLALRDAQTLAETVIAAFAAGNSPGAMSVLQQFLARQSGDQSTTITFSHYITRLFSTNNPALVWARKTGLFSIDLLPAVKAGFTRQAMGMGDRKTRLH